MLRHPGTDSIDALTPVFGAPASLRENEGKACEKQRHIFLCGASVEDKEFKNHELVVTGTFSVPSNEESRVCHHTLACFARFDCVCVCVCVLFV